MGGRIELPGGISAQVPDPPTQAEQALLNQLNQVVLALNTIAGQLDMMIRIDVQQIDKRVVRKRIEDNDATVRRAQIDAVNDANMERQEELDGQTTLDQALEAQDSVS